MTNGEYIRSMSDTELAGILMSCNYCSLNNINECDSKCDEHIKEWLEQERKSKQVNAQVCVECIACGKAIPIYDPRTDTSIRLCEDCKRGINYASVLLKKVFNAEKENDD